jgi:hypothetical protein
MDGIVALKPQFFNDRFTPPKAGTLWPFLLVEKLWLKKNIDRGPDLYLI